MSVPQQFASCLFNKGEAPRTTCYIWSNNKRWNTKLVLTGFVLILHCINYKNIRLHYTFAILHSNCKVVVCCLSGKSLSNSHIFFSTFCLFNPTLKKYGQSKGKIFIFLNSFLGFFCARIVVVTWVWRKKLRLFFLQQKNVISPTNKRYCNGGSSADNYRSILPFVEKKINLRLC